jgi:outer membrane protein assembly factor BamB
MKGWLSYRAVAGTSIVAGVFSLIVCLLLVVDFVHRGRYELFDSPQYLELKAELRANPNDERIKAEIRELDHELRAAYFRRRAFTATGVYLLLGGVLLTLATSRRAASLRPAVPHPQPVDEDLDREWRDQRYGRWAAAAVVLVVLVTFSAFAFRGEPVNPAALTRPATPPAGADDSIPVGESPRPDRPDALPADVPLPDPETYAQAWPCFRGPTGSGISAYSDIPQRWNVSDGEGILWKAEVPLPGFNSPIVWQQRVFVSGATADEQAIFCYDADSGELVWRHDVPPDPAAAGELEVFEATGYAAPTMATDGVRVYAIFATGDVVAVSMDGVEQWRKHMGVPDNPYGHASSLATYRDLLIIQMDQGTARDELSRVITLRGADGEVAWEVMREVPPSWASPIVVEHEGRAMVITGVEPWLIAYSPEDGRELWRARCLKGEVGPSPVFVDGVVYAANEMGGMAAVRADGDGDVTETHLVWFTDIGVPDVCSPLVTDRFVLMISHGYLACYDRAPPEDPAEATQPRDPLWEEDLGEAVVSSPGLVGSRVYLFSESEQGTGWIIEPREDQCERLEEFEMGEPCRSSPAFQAGRIYIRGDRHLFCIGEPVTHSQ